MKAVPRLPRVLAVLDRGVGEPSAAWCAAVRALPAEPVLVHDAQAQPSAALADIAALRVRTVRSGSGLERASHACFRALAPWIAICFGASAGWPQPQELVTAARVLPGADLVQATDAAGCCRLLVLPELPAALLRELRWESAPRGEELLARALDADLSVYSLPPAS